MKKDGKTLRSVKIKSKHFGGFVMEYRYIRVSSKEQNVGRQLDAFSKMKLDRKNIFIDKQSAKDFERPSYRVV